jgi:hypothetical protein
MIPKTEQGITCQFCKCCIIEALIQGYRVVNTDMKGLVTNYTAHFLINGIIVMWELAESQMTIRELLRPYPTCKDGGWRL